VLKKYEFNLERVWKVKKIYEDIKKNEFHKAKSYLEKKEQELKTLQEKLELEIVYYTCPSKGQSAPILGLSRNYINTIIKKIDFKKDECDDARDLLKEKRQQLINAVKERKTYDKLNEKRYEEYKEMVKKENQKKLDDNAMIVFTLDNRGR